LHKVKPHGLCSSPNIVNEIQSRKLRRVGGVCVARTEGHRNTYRALVVKCGRSRPLGRPTRKWEDNIERCLKERVWVPRLDLSGSGYEEVAGSYIR